MSKKELKQKIKSLESIIAGQSFIIGELHKDVKEKAWTIDQLYWAIRQQFDLIDSKDRLLDRQDKLLDNEQSRADKYYRYYMKTLLT